MNQSDVHQLGQGLHFEDFALGRKFRSVARTITEPDLCAFLNVTHMDEAVFTDMVYAAAHSAMPGRVVPGALCYAFAEGLCITDTLQFTGLAFLHMELDIKAACRVGDTIHVEIEVIEARRSKSQADRGLVRTRNTVVNQEGVTLLTYTPLRLVRCRG